MPRSEPLPRYFIKSGQPRTAGSKPSTAGEVLFNNYFKLDTPEILAACYKWDCEQFQDQELKDTIRDNYKNIKDCW